MYTFYIDGNVRTPDNSGSLSIDFEKNEDNGALFFRKELSDSLVYSGADYNYFASISDICQEITFRIAQECSTGTQTIYEGITAITKCSFNPDRCTVEVSITPDDAYSCILDNVDKEINILQEPNIVTVKVSDLQQFEYLVSNTSSGITDWDLVDTYTHSGIGEVFFVFARKVVASQCVGGVPQTPADDGSGQTWNLLSNNCATNNTSNYWRGLTTTESSLVVLALDYKECTLPFCPSAVVPPNSVFIGFASGAFEGVSVYILNNVVTDQDIPNGRLLTDVIDFMLSEVGCSLTLSSDFFTNITNPVTSNPSTTKDLLLYEKSDVRDPQASEKASKSLITIGQLLNDLNVLFNVRWNITGANLIIEHISDLSQSVGLDLTTLDGGKWIENKGAYEYINAEIPLEEKFKFPIDPVNIDFAGLPIEYNTQCSALTEQIFQTQRIETELDRIYKNDDEGLDGIVLVSPDTINKVGANSSLAENGRISGVFQPNAPLGYAALLPDYYTYDRPLPNGDINGVSTIMDSTRPLKQQQEIVFPYCCIGDFNPIEKVRTNLGDGEVLEATYNLKTKELALTIGFEL